MKNFNQNVHEKFNHMRMINLIATTYRTQSYFYWVQMCLISILIDFNIKNNENDMICFSANRYLAST